MEWGLNASLRAMNPSLRASGSRECAPDDRLREAIHGAALESWIASSQVLLAMTAESEGEASHRQPRAIIPSNRQRPHRARHIATDCDRDKMLGATLRDAFDENLPRRADLRF
jgi:hypothetical protein